MRTGSASALRLLALLATVAALYAGRPLLVPFCMAGLLALLLGPLVSRFECWLHLPRTPAVLLVVLVASATLVSLGWFVVNEATALAESVPQYRENVVKRLSELRGVTSQLKGVTNRIEDVKRDVETVTREATAPDSEDEEGTGAEGEDDAAEGTDERAAQDGSPNEQDEPDREAPAVPEPTEPAEPAPQPPVAERDSGMAPWLDGAGAFVSALGLFGAVAVLALFLLIYAPNTRDRVVQLLGPGNLSITTQALDEATGRVGSYLAATLLLNASYGIPVGIVLHLLGLPGAVLFAVLTTILRFIPYVGPWAAALLPILLSIAVFPTWTPTLIILGMFLTLELLSSNVAEPLLYGKSSGLSTLAVLFSAFFWAWMWGVAGLVLAVPLTLCLAVAGRYIPELSFFHVLLASDPSREHHTHFFRRIMAFDGDGAERIARAHLEERGHVALLDDLVLPALALAAQEEEGGRIDARRMHYLHAELEHVLDGLWLGGAGLRKAEAWEGRTIAIAPAGGPSDNFAARAMQRLLGGAAHQVVLLDAAPPTGEAESEAPSEAEILDPAVLILAAMPPGGLERSTRAAERMQQRFPHARLVVLAWGRSKPDVCADEHQALGIEHCARTLADALAAARESASAPPSPALV